jgi:hypothetical protein
MAIMEISPAKLLAHVAQMDQEELLDRVTVFREVMRPDAVEVMEAELARRGIGPDEIHQHHRQIKHRVLRDSHGIPAQCSWCERAAVEKREDFHKFWRLIPVAKRIWYYCDRHFAEKKSAAGSS